MNKTVTLFVALTLLCSVSLAAVLLSQDFSGTWDTDHPPAGWTITYSGEGPDNNDWNHNFGDVATLHPPPYDGGGTEDVLTSPVIDCGRYEAIVLAFRVSIYLANPWPPYYPLVQASTNGGSTWFDVYRFGYDEEFYWMRGISQATGCSQVRFRWYYYGNISDLYWWEIDNVTVSGTPVPFLDAATVSVDSPVGTVIGNWPRSPKATVKNLSTSPQSFDVKFSIADGSDYASTRTTPVLAPDEESQLTFDAWQPIGEGTFQTKCTTGLAGDQDNSNNRQTGTVKVVIWPAGWMERQPVPLGSSGSGVKGGAWLAHKPLDQYMYAIKGGGSGALYRYDIESNEWRALASVPAYGRGILPGDGSRGVHDGGSFIYATTGNDCPGFWRYNISEDRWYSLADVGAKLSDGTDLVCVRGTPDRVYLVRGNNGKVGGFYRYDVALNHWDYLQSVPGDAKWESGSFLTFDGDHTIYAHRAKVNELWAYDVSTERWGDAPLPGMPGHGSKGGGCGDWSDGGIFGLKGNKTREFWSWDAGTQVWARLEDFPSGGVSTGADLVSYGCGAFFAFRGNGTREFWRYVWTPEGSGGASAGAARLAPQFALSVAPNPMRLGAAISYAVPVATNLSLKLYDITGALARTIGSGWAKPGRYTADLSAKGLARGVYILKLESGTTSLTRKVVIE